MPQFDMAIYPGLIFWLFVVFVLLYIAVKWVFLGRIRGSIVHRESTLEGWLEEARELRDDAAKIAQEDEQRLKLAKNKALEDIAEILATAKEKQDAEEKATMDKLEAKRAQLRKDMQKTWADWQLETKSLSQILATLIMEKIGDSSTNDSKKQSPTSH